MMEEVGTLIIADETGDRKITWKRVKDYILRHPNKHDEVKDLVSTKPIKPKEILEPEDIKYARKMFDEKQAAHYDSYGSMKSSKIEDMQKITKYDPSFKFIVQVPHVEPRRTYD